MSAGGNNQLRAFFERWERLEADKQAISDDLKELFAEMKSVGFDTKAARAVFREKLADEDQAKREARDEFETICDLYRAALEGPRAHPARSAHVEIIEKFPAVVAISKSGEVRFDGSAAIPGDASGTGSGTGPRAPADESAQPIQESQPVPFGSNPSLAAREGDKAAALLPVDGAVNPDGASAPLGSASTKIPAPITKPQPVPTQAAAQPETVPPPAVSGTPSAQGAKSTADMIRLIRPYCAHADDLSKCAGYGRQHCHSCKKSANLNEAAA